MININKFGNTTAGTIPLCLWDYESRLRKGDNLTFRLSAAVTLGAPFTSNGPITAAIFRNNRITFIPFYGEDKWTVS